MTLHDLEALKLALDTNDTSFFHGQWEGAFLDVVTELLEARQATGGYEINEVHEAIEQLEALETELGTEAAKNIREERYIFFECENTFKNLDDELCILLEDDNFVKGRSYKVLTVWDEP